MIAGVAGSIVCGRRAVALWVRPLFVATSGIRTLTVSRAGDYLIFEEYAGATDQQLAATPRDLGDRRAQSVVADRAARSARHAGGTVRLSRAAIRRPGHRSVQGATSRAVPVDCRSARFGSASIRPTTGSTCPTASLLAARGHAMAAHALGVPGARGRAVCGGDCRTRGCATPPCRRCVGETARQCAGARPVACRSMADLQATDRRALGAAGRPRGPTTPTPITRSSRRSGCSTRGEARVAEWGADGQSSCTSG